MYAVVAYNTYTAELYGDAWFADLESAKQFLVDRATVDYNWHRENLDSDKLNFDIDSDQLHAELHYDGLTYTWDIISNEW